MITLMLRTGKEVRINPAFIDSVFCGQGGTGAFIGLAGDSQSQLEVRETPEQIAALVRAAEREARIRANAARFFVEPVPQFDPNAGAYGGVTYGYRSPIEAINEAVELELQLDLHFAALEAAQGGER